MKKRATLVISGDVQDVGFRGTVMRLAQKAGLVGYVENLPDGTVRAVCEGEEKAIKSFVKKLDIREGVIDVEAVKVEWSKPKGKFRYFEVKYSNLGAEMFQGFATAGRMLGDVAQKVDGVNTNIKSMHTDLKEGFSDLKSETRTTHEKLGSIDNRLGDALSRYDKIGKKMDNVETNLAELTKQITRLVDHVVEDKK